MNAEDLIQRLRVKYPTDRGEWATYTELQLLGHGKTRRTERRIDFVALGLWNSSGFRTVSVEVKVARSDWLAELEAPEKREVFENASSEFWIAAVKGVVDPAELPEGIGLFEPYGKGLRKVRIARYFRDRKPSEALLRQMVKRSERLRQEQIYERERIESEYATLRGRPISLEELRGIQKKLYDRYNFQPRTKFGVDKEDRGVRKKTVREWMNRWENVFTAIQNAMKRTDGARGWRNDPEEIKAWLDRQVAPAVIADKGERLASELRELANRLDPPKTE